MMDEVDWGLYEATICITPWTKIQWTHKHFSGFEATNHMLHKYGERLDNKCPACGEIERHTHVVQCTAPEATQKFEQLRNPYAEWLQRKTSHWMCTAILEQIDAYRDNRPVEVSMLWPEEIQQAVTKQRRIGTRSFIEGCIHRDWEGIQEDYLLKIQSRRSSR